MAAEKNEARDLDPVGGGAHADGPPDVTDDRPGLGNDGGDDGVDPAERAPVRIPLTGELDLHAFHPRDIPSVVEEYVHTCGAAGVVHLRLVHGRGRGVQRAVVRRTLAAIASVRSFDDAAPAAGGWGATVVELHESDEGEES